mmetsp:Transcript_2508/g.4721  ORF Transcript_2508/g.4721 Transcript_2508/m.4721 type:complete len:121 (-) Transcript_2508:198-560(-)
MSISTWKLAAACTVAVPTFHILPCAIQLEKHAGLLSSLHYCTTITGSNNGDSSGYASKSDEPCDGFRGKSNGSSFEFHGKRGGHNAQFRGRQAGAAFLSGMCDCELLFYILCLHATYQLV